jgi:hypothetical protein
MENLLVTWTRGRDREGYKKGNKDEDFVEINTTTLTI